MLILLLLSVVCLWVNWEDAAFDEPAILAVGAFFAFVDVLFIRRVGLLAIFVVAESLGLPRGAY